MLQKGGRKSKKNKWKAFKSWLVSIDYWGIDLHVPWWGLANDPCQSVHLCVFCVMSEAAFHQVGAQYLLTDSTIIILRKHLNVHPLYTLCSAAWPACYTFSWSNASLMNQKRCSAEVDVTYFCLQTHLLFRQGQIYIACSVPLNSSKSPLGAWIMAKS